MNKLKIKAIIKEWIFCIIGCILIAIGVVFFLLPLKISSGGLTGVATAFYYLFNFKMGYTILLLNIPLFLLGFFRIGKSFFLKTIFSTWFLSYLMDLLENINISLNIHDMLLASIYGGIIIGIGTSFIFLANSSTGGSELLINIILSFKKNASVSKLLWIIDSVVVLFNLIVFRQIDIGLYSFIVIYLNSKIVDLLAEGLDFSKVVYIISDNNKEISNGIMHELNKGVTGLYGRGMYEDKDMMVLLCVIRKRDVLELKRLVSRIDNKAFMIVADSTNVYGLGFENEL